MIRIFISLLLLSVITACDNDFGGETTLCNVNIRLTSATADEQLPGFDDATVSFTNLSTGSTTSYPYPLPVEARLLPGLYDVTFEATAGDMTYYGVERSAQILSDGCIVRLEVYENRICDDLVIAEVFFTGTLQTSGNQYYGDDYIRMYNNTDHVVYADGITIFESKFLTSEKVAYTPDIMSEAVTAHALYTIPGNGTEHPVAPGGYLLIADTGIDHRKVNPNSMDLSEADWEWYDESKVPSALDIDSPTVPNLDKWYCYTNSIFLLHNRGLRAIGIARLGNDKEGFLRDNWYGYDYEIVTVVGTFPMSGSAYRIPNSAIVDVVNCSVNSDWQWNVTDPSLDRGYTWCAISTDDKTRYGKAVRRKLLYVTDSGRAVLQDTNNSTADFNAAVSPSQMEETPTYDGLNPIR